MRRYLLMVFLFSALISSGQFRTTPEQDRIIAETKRLTQLDYQNMLDQLGISEVRPGANGRDPEAPNAANYDEEKANQYPDYPDPLLFDNGNTVSTAKEWNQKRSKEIRDAFDQEMYGVVPSEVPSVLWKVVDEIEESVGGIPVNTKKLIGHVDNSECPEITVEIELSLSIPKTSTSARPLMLQFSFSFPPWFPKRDNPNADKWKVQLLNEGWGYAQLKAITIQEDNGAGLTKGIIGLANKGARRTPEQWGALKAWAWGASRALDYFETEPAIDAARVGITGHSRFGKAALVTLAYEKRFAIGYISSSGAGGASLFRRNYGEIVENVAGSGEYHWMAGNFIKYAGPLQWTDLPADAHQLITLCAPRPVYIGSGNKGDQWTDQKGMFMAASKASPVYELLGKKGLETNVFPPLETELISGDIGHRQHNEGHTPAPNWPSFIRFAKKYF